MKEFFRKLIVGLKRKPDIIPLLVLLGAFVFYSLNLTNVSNTTAKIQANGMGLSGFVTMLFSLLGLVCAINSYPRRKPVNIPMLALLTVMMGVVIFCDVYYGGCIRDAVTRANNPISAVDNPYIPAVQSMLNVHIVIVAVGIVLAVALPLYAPLIRKINTSIDVEENDEMGELELGDAE